MFTNFLPDLRFALRQFLKSPGFTLAAVLSLALGIGANTALFGLLDHWVLRPVNAPHPESLVCVWRSHDQKGSQRCQFTPRLFQDLRAGAGGFEGLACVGIRGYSVESGDAAFPVEAIRVSGDLFGLLSVRPEMGRLAFTPEEASGARKAVILTHRLWMSRFAGDPAVLGRSFRLDGESFAVIGVLPESFRAPSQRIRNGAIYVPAAFASAEMDDVDFEVLGRLKPRFNVAQTDASLKALEPQLGLDPHTHLWAESLVDALGHSRRGMLMTLQAAVALVLLIACINVANLLLAKGVGRRQEMAIRSALGAGQGSLVRQLLTESLLLGIFGGLLGLGFARAMLLGASRLRGLRLDEAVSLDGRAFAFCLLVAMLASLIFGLLPAWQTTHARPQDALREGMVGPARLGWRKGLVVGEVALATALLVGSGMLLRSLFRQLSEGSGLQAKGVQIAGLALPSQADGTRRESQVPFLLALEARLQALPGCEKAALCTPMPLYNAGGDGELSADGAEGKEANAWPHFITPSYFDTVGIKLLTGRVFGKSESGVCVISQPLARSLWPGQEALGRRVRWGGHVLEVVGIVSGTKEYGFDEPLRPQIFLPVASPMEHPLGGLCLLVKGHPDPRMMVHAVASMGPGLVIEPESFDGAVNATLGPLQEMGYLFGAFAALALALAMLGVHGVLSFLMRQRAREIGLRMALGARIQDVVRSVVSKGMGMVALGLALGSGGAVMLTRGLEHWLYGISLLDPFVWLVVSGLLLLASLMACLEPALRAASVDPALVLRGE